MKINYKYYPPKPNHTNHLPSLISLTSSYKIQSAFLRGSRKNTCISCSVIGDLSLSCSSVGLFMGGWLKTSTQDVIRRAPPSPYWKSEMGTASVASPTLSGHQIMSVLVTVVRCSSTSPRKQTSNNKRLFRYSAEVTRGLCLEEIFLTNRIYVYLNHLMMRKCVNHGQMNLVTVSLNKMALTCWLTRRMDTSQSLR